MQKKAFTLIELTLVVVIIGIIASVAIIKYGPVIEKAYSAEAYSVLSQIASAENVYKLESSTSSYVSCANTAACNTALDLDLVSENFDLQVNTSNKYAKADNRISSGGSGKSTYSYYMCLNGGKRSNAHISDCP